MTSDRLKCVSCPKTMLQHCVTAILLCLIPSVLSYNQFGAYGSCSWFESPKVCIRVWRGPRTLLTSLNNQHSSLSGVNGLKDFVCSDHPWVLLRQVTLYLYNTSISLNSTIKGLKKMVTTENSWHWWGVDCRVSLKMIGCLLTLYRFIINN